MRLFSLLLLGISCSTSAPHAPVPVDYTAHALARMPNSVTLDLPSSSRPDGVPAPDVFPLSGTLEKLKTSGDVDIYGVPLPLREHRLTTRQGGARSFGSYLPPGLALIGPEGPVRHDRHAKRVDSWGFTHKHLMVSVAKGAPPPQARDYGIQFPSATEGENQLNLATSGQGPTEFAFRTVTLGLSAHVGLYLPAPAAASWSLRLPTNAVLDLSAIVLPPEVQVAGGSDGSEIVVAVTPPDGEEIEAGRFAVTGDIWTEKRVDLSDWGEQDVVLILRTEPGASANLDYVFIEEPTVFTPKDDPKQIVLVFPDTVRPDHLSLYGYDRPTTPLLDTHLRHATRFDQARNVAPWTLPSVRAALSGAQPERWSDVENLPSRLAEAGFLTTAVVGNAYLSMPFEMHRGWSSYTYDHLRPAKRVIDQALATFEAHPDRDQVVMVHFMEAHLPYQEPKSFRELFVTQKPDHMEHVLRSDLVKLKPRNPEYDITRQYVIDRYDQNIRVVDVEVSRLLDALSPDATVVLFSDHGEEFWDHGGFEHGHTFHDELLHVPLVIRDPHLPAGAVTAPVSLLDLTPTLLELVGLPHDVEAGQSLVGVALGRPDAIDALAQRPQAFGRPLYGADGWGVLHEDHKWYHRDGIDWLFDLEEDPEEKANRARDTSTATYPPLLGETLEREVRQVWRVTIRSRSADEPVTLRIDTSAEIDLAWTAYDPRGYHLDAPPRIDEQGVSLTQAPGDTMPGVIYIAPVGDPQTLTLTASITGGGTKLTAEPTPPEKDIRRQVILKESDRRRGVTIDLAWVPVPSGSEVPAFHPDVADQLKELGYLDP